MAPVPQQTQASGTPQQQVTCATGTTRRRRHQPLRCDDLLLLVQDVQFPAHVGSSPAVVVDDGWPRLVGHQSEHPRAPLCDAGTALLFETPPSQNNINRLKY